METLIVTVKYGSEEACGNYWMYEFTKTFELEKLPCVPAYILLSDSAYPEVFFKNPDFDPKHNIYRITVKSTKGLDRYYGSREFRQMTGKSTEELFRNNGWTVRPIDDIESE